MKTKAALRKEIKQKINSYTRAQLDELSSEVCEHLLTVKEVMDADTVLAYWSLPSEVCTHNLIRQFIRQGKCVLLPKVISDSEMAIHRYTSDGDMQVGAYGILEPTTEALPEEEWTALLQKSLGIIPGVSFDVNLNRLGRGKGYYDRVLAKLPDMFKIGICFPFQLQNEIPTTNHDIAMNMVCCGYSIS